jgi:hypothetical protein
MAPEHSGTMAIFDAFPRAPSTGKELDAILPKRAVEANENLKVLLPGNMKEAVECADPIEAASIELQSPHVHLDKACLRDVGACQVKHGGGDIDTGYVETRMDQEPRHWESCPTPDVKHITTRRQQGGIPSQQLIAYE